MLAFSGLSTEQAEEGTPPRFNTHEVTSCPISPCRRLELAPNTNAQRNSVRAPRYVGISDWSRPCLLELSLHHPCYNEQRLWEEYKWRSNARWVIFSYSHEHVWYLTGTGIAQAISRDDRPWVLAQLIQGKSRLST